MSDAKDFVLHPISYHNTIGQEVLEIIDAHGYSCDDFSRDFGSSQDTIKTKEKLKASEIEFISSYIKQDQIKSYIKAFQTNYSEIKKKATQTYKEHFEIFKKVKHLQPLLRGEFNDGIDILEDISTFLNIENEKEIFDKVNDNVALYKLPSYFEADNLNLYAWLKRGELDYFKLNLNVYEKEKLVDWVNSEDWRSYLHSSSYFKSLPALFSTFGVGLIFTPYLNKTAHGAVRWYNNCPLIQISDKDKCLATAWYVLFHEIGHVLLHENEEIFDCNYEDIPKYKITEKEKEANQFAAKLLFKGDNLRKLIFTRRGQAVMPTFISNVANDNRVNEMFVAYWMKKANVRSGNIYQYLPKIEFTYSEPLI